MSRKVEDPNKVLIVSGGNRAFCYQSTSFTSHVTDGQDWETVDNEDCWGMNYTLLLEEIKEKTDSLLQTWGGGDPVEKEEARINKKPDKETFSVPHASRDPEILKKQRSCK